MIPLILFVCLAIFVLVSFEIRARKNPEQQQDDLTSAQKDDSECCGQHLVCEKETLLNSKMEIEYFDDEELDQFAGINAEDYTDEQYKAIADVFYTLQEKDIPGWVRSLQMRNINLPMDIREQALMIVIERRSKKTTQKQQQTEAYDTTENA